MSKAIRKVDKVKAVRRSICPITNTLDLLGDKWTLILVRDLFLGKRTYGEFQASPEGIPTNILAERLRRLLENNIIVKQAYQEKPVRYAYSLSEKGKALAPIVKEIARWGLTYIPGTEAKLAKEYLKKNKRQAF
ncbi:MAG: helix-turn-helix transcriptional regulator [Gammaproteobacteria bacterium]|nr:helix-turn-helix transcriptional regulator [Gammaproteobacteria bacterium]